MVGRASHIPECGICCKGRANYENAVAFFNFKHSGRQWVNARIISQIIITRERSLMSWGIDSPKNMTSGLCCIGP